jgi:hypothetical protein
MSDLASTWAQGVRLSLSDNAEELADSGSLDTRTPKDDEDTKSPTVNGASNSLTIDEAASSWTENSVSDAVVTNVLPQETMSVIDRGIMAVKLKRLKGMWWLSGKDFLRGGESCRMKGNRQCRLELQSLSLHLFLNKGRYLLRVKVIQLFPR